MKNRRNVKECVALTMNNKTFLGTCWAQFKLNAKFQIIIRQFEKNNKNEGCWKIILLKNKQKKLIPEKKSYENSRKICWLCDDVACQHVLGLFQNPLPPSKVWT